MEIVAHCLVKNEENFVWYAINSIVDCVDKIMVWDNGSSDATRQIIESIKNPKIFFEEKGKTDERGTARLRQSMLDKSDADWILLLDGDEIWWDGSIKELVNTLKITDKDVLVTHPIMLIGDMFHFQEEAAGKYHIGGKVGHYNIRAVRKTSDLHVEGVYPNEAFVTRGGIKVQDLAKEQMVFFEKPYLHASFLKRSTKGKRQVKHEIGNSFPLDFYYPEVFFRPRPAIVPYPFQRLTMNYMLRAVMQTPLKKIKRRIL